MHQAVSPAGSPPADGYVLGVDLGTSHSVAVVRWPDGRARPLLVDGAPVMPSAVYLDESGHIHVGRDAQRLAQTDPTRFEPNPKHRIGDSTVLLGDREVPVTTLLSAILREVAAKAVEAVGHLPPAVLTCPAKWGPQRRAVLEDAAAQAGFPPVRLVPEPVAAAHYFAEVLRRPIPMGKSVAVFDFGGGTLDIAVVRHENDGTYAVQADGGLEDLGGLDVDAALVDYVGRTINGTVPQIWQQLTQPQNGNDRRNRRLFWDDVRGAKEMLSRTTVAPIPVPGVESALHLTREELEKLAGPLLQRAVVETRRVVAAAGQTPEQLAGLFLVGGASRIPLVGRLLHAQLGIAPTVLEQPELPVAEGSLAAAFPAAAAVSPVTAPPGEPYPPPPPGGTPQQGFFAPPPPPKPWYKRKSSWFAAAAGVVVLALVTGFLMYERYPQQPLHDTEPVGKAVGYPDGIDPTTSTFLTGDTDSPSAYMAMVDTEEYAAHLTSIDLETGRENWTSEPFAQADSSGTGDWRGPTARNGIVTIKSVGYDKAKLYFVKPDSGTAKSIDIGVDDSTYILGDKVLRIDTEAGEVIAYNGSGEQQWSVEVGEGYTSWNVEDNWSFYEEPRGGDAVEDGHFVAVRDGESNIKVIDTDQGKVTAESKLGDSGSAYYAYEGKLLVASGSQNYNLAAYDMAENLKHVGSWKPGKEAPGVPWNIRVCGETRVCVNEEDPDEPETVGSFSVFDLEDTEGGSLWQSPKNTNVNSTDIAGETLALRTYDADNETWKTQLYDDGFEKIGPAQDGYFARIDSGSFLEYPTGGEAVSTAEPHEVRGLGAQDGQLQKLGSEMVFPGCTSTAEQLVCPAEKGYSTWRFRN